MHRSGVPVDVVQVVVGGGAAGAALVDTDIDMVCFTGSYATGRRSRGRSPTGSCACNSSSAARTRRTSCDDVDVEDAALAIAEGAFYNAGQSCCAIERVYVHEAVFDRFVDAFVEVVGAYNVGDPPRKGPISARWRGPRNSTCSTNRSPTPSRRRGGACGGSRIDRPGNWFEPTVLVDVDARMRDDARREVRPGDRRRTRPRATTRRARLWTTPSSVSVRSVRTRTSARGDDPRPPRRRQRVLEHDRPFERAAARGPAAATPASASRCPSPACAFVREKAWHLAPVTGVWTVIACSRRPSDAARAGRGFGVVSTCR